MSKRVYDTEQKMAQMRDNQVGGPRPARPQGTCHAAQLALSHLQYDAMDFKNDARNARLSIKHQQ